MANKMFNYFGQKRSAVLPKQGKLNNNFPCENQSNIFNSNEIIEIFSYKQKYPLKSNSELADYFTIFFDKEVTEEMIKITLISKRDVWLLHSKRTSKFFKEIIEESLDEYLICFQFLDTDDELVKVVENTLEPDNEVYIIDDN